MIEVIEMTDSDLSPRSLKILKALVEHYIRDGQPVGSKVLAQDSQLVVSSATIRSIMADLEYMGYLTSPHTSSGRVPTTPGYRLFIDHFITVQQPAVAEVQHIQQQLETDADAKQLVMKASHLLSGITQLTGLVTMPRLQSKVVEQVEFLSLSESRVLVVLVFKDRDIQNRVIQTKKIFSRTELEQAGHFLTAQFKGKDLLHIRQSLFDELKQSRQDLDVMLQSVMSVAEESRQQCVEQTVVVDGETNLFGQVDIDNIAGLKYIFDAFTQKNDLLHLLDQCIQAQGIKIFVGEETGHVVLDRYSMIVAPYSQDGAVVGVLGVIGPRRMPYQKVISTVDITAKLLSNAFNLQSDPD